MKWAKNMRHLKINIKMTCYKCYINITEEKNQGIEK